MPQDRNLTELLSEKNIHAPEILEDFVLPTVLDYFDFLVSENERGGFFSKNDAPLILERHLFESMVFVSQVARQAKVSRETRVVDVGTGPGLPGFLFACLKSRPHVTLMDSSRRRLQFVEQFVKERPPLKGIHFVYERSEEVAKTFDLITARALIPYPSVLEILLPLMKKGTQVYLFQSRFNSDRSEKEKKYLESMGLGLKSIVPLPVLSFLGERNIIQIEMNTKPSAGYPRSWKVIKNEIKTWEN